MWKSTVDGRALRFSLCGINNQNFIMSDDDTGTWWQQVSGEALHGPLAGKRLEPIHWDEVTFAVWKADHPDTRVLLPDAATEEHYATPEWEERIASRPLVTPVDPADPLEPRDLVAGVAAGGRARAYPWQLLIERSTISDTLGDLPLFFVAHPDGRSVRCFDRRVDGTALEFTRKETVGTEAEADPAPRFTDTKTNSEWDFTGRAVAGTLAGEQLARVTFLKDFWFDWKIYNPATDVYAAKEE